MATAPERGAPLAVQADDPHDSGRLPQLRQPEEEAGLLEPRIAQSGSWGDDLPFVRWAPWGRGTGLWY